MPGLLHIGVGFGAKRWAPGVPVVLLIIAAEFTEILFFLCLALGLESMPAPGKPSWAPYSHSLVMALISSAFFVLVLYILFRKKFSQKDFLVLGILAVGHILLDIMASPKTAFFPDDGRIPLFFNPDNVIGLGVWRYRIPAMILEYGGTALGILLYVITVLKARKKKKDQQNGIHETAEEIRPT